MQIGTTENGGGYDFSIEKILNWFNSNISTTSVITALLVTAVAAIYIIGMQWMVCRQNFYSKSFDISLPIIAVITASIILPFQSSVVISMDMVGALSLVPFRPEVKAPMDLGVPALGHFWGDHLRHRLV